MNKYQEAYKIASNLKPRDLLDKKVREAVDLVKEACDKAEKYDEKETPKEVFKESLADALCPICHRYINFDCLNDDVKYAPKYCSYCGTALNFSKAFNWRNYNDK